jgi:myosin-crossreactive antigen
MLSNHHAIIEMRRIRFRRDSFFTMAQFMPRKNHDRPLVVPKKSKNFAFLGQFTEIPDDVIFTVEFPVRCAQTAVYELLESDIEVTPIYKGCQHILWNLQEQSFINLINHF